MHRLLLLAAAWGLLVAACGDDDTAPPAAAPTTAVSTPVTATAAPEATPAATTPAASATASPAATPTTTSAATATSSPTATPTTSASPGTATLEMFALPAGSRPHDVAPAVDGGVWYTAQGAGALGWLDPGSGETQHIDLGAGSRPHGVIVGADGDAWVTDSGLNAIVRVDDESREVTVYPLPGSRPNANLNTAAFDGRGVLWFTGQNGIVGRLDPATGEMAVFDSPRDRGPYGIAATADGDVYFASLAGSYVGHIDVESDAITVLQPPTAGQGARRVWPDSQGRIWVSEWNAGAVAMYDPSSGQWREWDLPGSNPRAYAVYVDEFDRVWLSDFGANALVVFDPVTERFESFAGFGSPANVRQLLGRAGALGAPESAADQLVVVRY